LASEVSNTLTGGEDHASLVAKISDQLL
jgi:hypothetical protein